MTDLFVDSPITYSDKVGCIRRELSYRRRLYPRWIETGKMKQDDADREIAVMASIENDYAKCVELEQRGKR